MKRALLFTALAVLVLATSCAGSGSKSEIKSNVKGETVELIPEATQREETPQKQSCIDDSLYEEMEAFVKEAKEHFEARNEI